MTVDSDNSLFNQYSTQFLRGMSERMRDSFTNSQLNKFLKERFTFFREAIRRSGMVRVRKHKISQISLTEKKVNAGADFFISQPSFDALRPRNFLEQYREYTGVSLGRPVLWGIQMMVRDSISFAAVPDSLQKDLDLGLSLIHI